MSLASCALVTRWRGLDGLDSGLRVNRLPRCIEPEEPTMNTSQFVRICIAAATVALGLVTYSLIVALQSAAI
jgi:hypothetical protein